MRRLLYRRQRRPPVADRESPPIVLISSCASPQETGDHVYNGGVKLYNLWVKLLREHGYPAYVVTYDGAYEPWLIEHQPHISLETVKRWRDGGLPLRFVTGWLGAAAFINVADKIYFYDPELAYSSGVHRSVLDRLRDQNKLRAVATNSRTQQAWHMAYLDREVCLIPEWSDDAYWRPNGTNRTVNLIGYMNESPEAEDEIELIAERCERADLDVSFLRVEGTESDILASMQQCDLFVGLNRGKHPLWGEGCPRSPQEAMHAGAVVVAYDVHGNREYLIDGFSGLIAPRGQPEALAERLIALLRDPDLKEHLRRNGSSLAAEAFTPALRWPLLRDFLDLEELGASTRPDAAFAGRETLETALGAPVYLGEEEVPAFAAYAAAAKDTIVELGAAYGGSTLLFNMAAPDACDVVSVDPFVPDSMNGFRASPSDCWRNVHRGARALGSASRLARWTLRIQASHELSPAWDRPIGLLFIDGDHTYEAVRRDFEEWLPFVRPGGTILLHDSRRLPGAPDDEFNRGWPGPTRLAAELADHACVRLADEVFSTTVWQKTGDPCAACGAAEGTA